MENRIKMQILIFFYILGINIFQATGGGTILYNSTQMLYFNVTIDESVEANITQLLQSFGTDNFFVDNLEKTTFCENLSDGSVHCICQTGYSWSDKVCLSTPNCCGTPNCTFSQNQAHTCIANTTVTISGNITLNSLWCQNCLAETSSDNYINCNKNLTSQMQAVYSTLVGFDVLRITKYSVGSVVATFQIIIVSDINAQTLLDKSQALTQALGATLTLVTTGVVRISMPTNPVCYNSKHIVTCTSQTDLGVSPTWQLKQQGVIYNITNGTEATVISEPTKTAVNLTSITELWEGEYICSYIISRSSNNAKITIIHQDSAVMDVALQPNIGISTIPQFPHCTSGTDLLFVTINCQIPPAINKTYNVTWSTEGITAAIIAAKYSPGQTVYSADTAVGCASIISQVKCTFVNACNQTIAASAVINTIAVGDQYCSKDGPWEDTKAGYTAVIQCKNSAGTIKRSCSSTAQWGDVISGCVNQDLYTVLQKATIIDIGLGSMDRNAGTVFSQLHGVTNNSQIINGFPNMNTSVHVLLTLSGKLTDIQNVSSVDDLLESSSNLLNRSLQNSWETNTNNSNQTLPETYLSSVEHLISIANLITDKKQLAKPFLVVDTCSGLECSNTVFNVNITLKNTNNGTVKSVGFQNLQEYLHCSEEHSQPNSIVVSTTTKNTDKNSVNILINFPLLKPRPPNVQLQCVAWNFNTSSWSGEGCSWGGADKPGTCVCTHLSSFAILMSSHPLEIRGSDEITYAGLSVSIISLLISLVIEMIVWSTVVKTNTLYLRHTAHVNISLCLLVADCSFLASSMNEIPAIWCQTFAVLKHFCYLAMFFWMLGLSITLLHQAIFLFHNVSKKNYLRFSLVLGYVCPFLIVFITFLTNNSGAEGMYYNSDGCWLIYTGLLEGSIFTFILPVGIIIFINVFSMLVVIMKLLDHPKSTDKSQTREKTAAKTVVRTVILLTPIFGITWTFGFAVMILDLTSGVVAYAANYAFIVLNAFQGFFILLTTCLGDKMVRETLMNRLRKNHSASISESTTKFDSSLKK